ncbi:hypothetical protein M378DRAFT_163369, partial [Amanita muscaria Koide BX008]
MVGILLSSPQDNLSTRQGETWNIPPHMLLPSTSQPSTAPEAQPATHPYPRCAVLTDRAGKRIFRCECGHETTRKGDMRWHQSLIHSGRYHVCHCGRGYHRKSSLSRHKMYC